MTIYKESIFKGKQYLVTGASSGIGRSVAQQVASLGGKVILSGRNEERLLETLSSLESPELHDYSVQELCNADETAAWARGIAKENGELSGIFHAAGIELVRPTRMIKQRNIEEVFGSSIFAAFGLSKAASQKGVLNDGGSIVFMSSVTSSSGQAGLSVYSSAKAAVDGLTRSLAIEMAPRRIRVNSLVAGAVETEMHNRVMSSGLDEALQKYEESHLFGFGSSMDISNAVIFLLSDASTWITGSSMVVDGGFLVR